MADKRSGPPSRGGGFGGNSRGGPSRGPARGGPSRDGGGRGPSRGGPGGGFGGGSRDGGGERSSRPFGDRPPRREGDRPFGDRPPRREGDRPFGDRPPPRRDGGGFGGPPRGRPSGDRPFGDRPPRRDGDRPFGDRPPRRDGDRPFGDRPPRDSRPSYDRGPPRDRPAGDRPYNDRPQRSFDDRPPRREESDDRAPRKDRDMPFEDRPRRSFQKDGFGSSRKRDDMDTTRPRSDDRPERREYSSDRPPQRREYSSDRPPRRDYDDKPPRREGFEKRPDKRDDNDMDDAPKGMKGHETLIYGVHAAQAALRNPNRKVTTIWVSDIGSAHLEGAMDAARHPEPEVITKREIEHKLPAGAVHQGIAIAVEPLDDVYLSDILTAANVANVDRHVVVVLDEVTDPHNVGAVLRSMSMFGAKAMIVHKRNAPSITGVMAKIATGAIEHVPMVAVTNLSQAMEEMKLAGFYCLGLDENATISLGDVPTDRPIALVLGNEGEGLRAKTRTTCDAIVSIESFGAIKSLNVSNAAAIALYSITKK